MADMSSDCRAGRHSDDSRVYEGGYVDHKGCWGTARDVEPIEGTYRVRHIDHPCRCGCHAAPSNPDKEAPGEE